MEDRHAVVLCVVMFIVGMLFWVGLDVSTGTNYRLSTPIANLEPGQIYEVRGIYRDGTSCSLLLLPEGKKVPSYYNITSSSVPMEVVVGDKIAKLSNGITIQH